MRNIDLHVPPMELFVIWSGGYTSEECDQIIQFGELADFAKAKIGSGQEITTDEEIRDTDITWIQPHEDAKWIFERMNELAGKINFDKFQMDLDRFDGFQYSKYKVDGHYSWHTDTILTPPNGLFRKLSFSVMLTDPDDYEGGELLLSDKGSEVKATSLRPKKGDVVVFYSHLPHKVAPVTKGERLALVTWALGPKPK